MGIPTIEPYSMPTPTQLPSNVAGWRPEPDRAVLLIHDMQRYFLDFFSDREPVTELITNTRRIREAAVAAGVPVVYTAQRGMTETERGLLRDFWGPGMRAEPAATQITPELAPADTDPVLTKWRYSAFHRSELEELLRRHGRDQLIVCGVYAHVGCLMTVCDAFTRDIEAFLVADAVADFTAEYHRLALEYAATRCAVTPTTEAVLAALRGDSDRPGPLPAAQVAGSAAPSAG